jgi:hypothetical protein
MDRGVFRRLVAFPHTKFHFVLIWVLVCASGSLVRVEISMCGRKSVPPAQTHPPNWPELISEKRKSLDQKQLPK